MTVAVSQLLVTSPAPKILQSGAQIIGQRITQNNFQSHNKLALFLAKSVKHNLHDFVVAVLEVYDHAELAKILQAKFFLPNESNYTDEAYYQSASELSVARYIKQKEKQKLYSHRLPRSSRKTRF